MVINQEDVYRLEERIKKEITTVDSNLLSVYPIQKYIERIEQKIFRGRPWCYPDTAYRYCAALENRTTEVTFMNYHKLLMLEFLKRLPEKMHKKRIPSSISSYLRGQTDRILLNIQKDKMEFFTLHNGLFRLDVNICRTRLIPCGVEVVDEYSGFPIRFLLRGIIKQRSAVVRMIKIFGCGFSPFYETHMDRRTIRLFCKEEFEACYLRVAEMLAMNSEYKGVISNSWWNDPKLEIISPSLNFLRKLPVSNGAILFRGISDSETVEDATMFSTKRRELFQKGAYIPTRYIVVWPRDSILSWADRVRREQLSSQKV